eukprot:scaffold143719_cov17-Prasinocladus_malaysianus.AAC.1
MSPGRVYPSLVGNSSSQKTSWHQHDSVTRIYAPINVPSESIVSHGMALQQVYAQCGLINIYFEKCIQ